MCRRTLCASLLVFIIETYEKQLPDLSGCTRLQHLHVWPCASTGCIVSADDSPPFSLAKPLHIRYMSAGSEGLVHSNLTAHKQIREGLYIEEWTDLQWPVCSADPLQLQSRGIVGRLSVTVHRKMFEYMQLQGAHLRAFLSSPCSAFHVSVSAIDRLNCRQNCRTHWGTPAGTQLFSIYAGYSAASFACMYRYMHKYIHMYTYKTKALCSLT